MRPLAPDTRRRVSARELAAVPIEGDPAAATAVDLATGERTELEPGDDGTFAVPAPALPRLVRVEWRDGAAEVSAELDAVSRRYCEPGDVLGYRRDEYRLSDEHDEDDAAEAIDRAEAEIESACGRALQPVMRLGFVDRGCSTRRLVAGDGGYDACLTAVVSATDADGRETGVRQARPGSPYLDVSALPPGGAARVAYVTGLPRVPSEAAAAVVALAAWHLSQHGAPDNATSASTDVGVINYVVAGVAGAPTSLPEVNALIDRYRLVGCGVA